MSNTVPVIVMALIVLIACSHAGPLDPPAGYYAPALGKKGTDLADALHEIVDDHTVIPYQWDAYRVLDEAPSSPDRVSLIYSEITRLKTENGGNQGDWNREHIWPRSYGIGSSGEDNSDVFNIRPCDVQVNSTRANLYFDITSAADSAADYSIPDAPGCSLDSDSWQPHDSEKGDVARACFYMAVRYDGSDPDTSDLVLGDSPDAEQSRFGDLLTLLQWHREDPVSEAERERNQVVFESYQHNRNPFVDHPQFAEMVFLENHPEVDRDNDGISDYWEWWAVGNLAEASDTDTDFDGITTLLEYALLLDPGSPDAAHSPSIIRTETSVVFTYRRNRDAANLIYEVQASSALGTDWVPVVPLLEESVPDGDVEMVSVTVAAAEARRFFRLAINP